MCFYSFLIIPLVLIVVPPTFFALLVLSCPVFFCLSSGVLRAKGGGVHYPGDVDVFLAPFLRLTCSLFSILKVFLLLFSLLFYMLIVARHCTLLGPLASKQNKKTDEGR